MLSFKTLLLLLLILWSIVYFLKDKIKKATHGKVEVQPLAAMIKYSEAEILFQKIHSKLPFSTKTLLVVGLPLLVFSIIWSSNLLIGGLLSILYSLRHPAEGPAIPRVVPVIPGYTVPLSVSLIISIGVGIFIHELFHGIACITGKIKIKSAGILFFLFFPGGFVEPDENSLEKSSLKDKVAMLLAGSISNLLLTLITIAISLIMFHGLSFFLASSIFNFAYADPMSSGVFISKVLPGTPAAEILSPGTVIYSINNIRTKNWIDLLNVLYNSSAWSIIALNTSKGVKYVALAGEPGSTGFLGVVYSPFNFYLPRKWISWIPPSSAHFLSELLIWMFTINFVLAMLNLIPVYPFDGARIFQEVIYAFLSPKIGAKGSKILFIVISAVFTALLLINLGYSIYFLIKRF